MATQAASSLRIQQKPLRFFFSGLALLAAAMIFAGFARTYYLKFLFGTPELSLLLHLHGIVMTSWMALMLVQTTLVAAHRTDIHRRLGVLGGAIAAAVVIIGPMVAIRSVQLGHVPVPGVNPFSFMAVPLGDVVVFGTLVAAALVYRRRPDLHKRLMLIATIAILPPGIARWPVSFVAKLGPFAFFGLADLLLIGCVAYDFAKTRRLNPAYLWGGLFLIASHPLRLMLGGTAPWLHFAHWLAGV